MLLKACIFPELKNNGKNTFPECTYHDQRGERLMKQRLQRILSILCILALLAGCVMLPAFAAEATVPKAVVIEWDDEGCESIRPSAVSATFGSEKVTLDPSNNWSGSVEVAARTVTDETAWTIAVDTNTYTISKTITGNVTVFTVSFNPGTADPVSVSVSVIDSIAAPSGQPTSARISLLEGEGDNKKVCRPPQDVSIASGEGGFQWDNLPAYKVQNEAKVATVYSISAEDIPGYTTNVSGFSVTYTQQTASLSLKVTVSGVPDGESADDLELKVTGPGLSRTLTYADVAAAGGTYSFGTVLPGAYVVQETNGSELFKGYVMDPGNTQVGDAVYVDANESGTLNIKYTWQKETSVAKPEGNPKDGESALKIKIIGPGGYEKEITYQDILEAGGTYTLNDLAPGSYAVIETNAEGLIKTYTLKSESETGVAVIVGKGEDGVIASLFNKYKQPPVKMDIPVVKVWNDNDDKDGNRPGAITVILSADGVEVDRATLTADVEWKHTFTDLDVFDAEGKEITYSVSETAVEWYTAEVNGYSITNNYNPEVTSVSVVKVWDDNDDALRRRPSSIAVTLLPVGDVYILSAENGWSATADNLPKKINGKAVNYSWSEQEVVGYVKAGASTSGSATTFTNRLPLIPEIPPDQPQPKTPGETWYYFGEYDTALGGNVLINHVGDCFD